MYTTGGTNLQRSRRIVRRYHEHLNRQVKVDCAVVFGSVARGENNRYSDIDLLVVAADLPADFWRRLDLLWEEKPPELDVLGFTPAEVKARISRPLLLDAFGEGITVQGRAAPFRRLARGYLRKNNLRKVWFGYLPATLVEEKP